MLENRVFGQAEGGKEDAIRKKLISLCASQ